MPMLSSGEICLASSTEGRGISQEVGQPCDAEISLNQSNVRTLSGTTAGNCIRMGANFYNRIFCGRVYCGGYLAGTVSSPANYYLIVAPNATGCICTCQWQTNRTAASNTGSCTDGYFNTYVGQSCDRHPLGNWAATRSINGFSDWYLPAKDETTVLFNSRNSMPPGEDWRQTFSQGVYSTSTESSSIYFCGVNMNAACYRHFQTGKETCQRSRIIRRVPI